MKTVYDNTGEPMATLEQVTSVRASIRQHITTLDRLPRKTNGITQARIRLVDALCWLGAEINGAVSSNERGPA